jgi:hypothetical protein
MQRLVLFLLAVVLLVPALLTSCRGTGKPEAEVAQPKAEEIRKEYRKGPFSVRVIVDKGSISIAENLVLTIEAELEQGSEVEFPRFGEKLGEFGIRDYREDPPRLTSEGKFITAKNYTLEPFLSGDYAIAPMQLRFRKKADGAGGGNLGANEDRPWDHEISTEAITIRVHSLIEKDRNALNPIKGPVGLPAEPFSFWTIALGLGIAGLTAGAAFFIHRRRRTAAILHPFPAPPAHELAYRQLQEIFDERLIERGELKLFFAKISDVLRSYIENRFQILAPRRTTEEFLLEISRDAPFAAEHQALLSEFLQNCDLVKFAEHTPAPTEIAKALDSCKAFIDATRADAQRQRTGDGGTRRHGDTEKGR